MVRRAIISFIFFAQDTLNPASSFTASTPLTASSSGIWSSGWFSQPRQRHSALRRHNNMIAPENSQEKEPSPGSGEEKKSNQPLLNMDGNEEEDAWREGEDAMDNDLLDEYCSILDDFGCEAYEDLSKTLEEKVHRWVRLEVRPDESLKDIQTKEDVLRKIEQAREEQSQFGPADLYSRRWQSTTLSNSNEVNFSPEEGQVSYVNGDRPPCFSLLQFNCLAEGLSAGPNVKTPFPPVSDKDEIAYGGFTGVKFPEVTLDFSSRRWRILEVLLGTTSVGRDSTNDEGVFDVLAMEEVDRFRGFFAPLLRIFGYEGIFMPKSRAPGVPIGFYSDGCALFWKTQMFEFVSEQRLKYKVGNQVVLLVTLKHRLSGLPLLFAVTHLKARRSEANEKLRALQAAELLDIVQEAAEMEAQKVFLDSIPSIIVGDLNADPPSELGYLDSCVKRILSNHVDATTNSSSTRTSMRFRSAYTVDPPPDGYYTTWKTRGKHTAKRVIDYIFHSDSLACTDTLAVPSNDDLEESKLPGLRYPSDHMMIAAKFEVNKNPKAG